MSRAWAAAKRADEIGIGAVAGIDVVKIGDVVAGIAHGRDETGVEPDGVATDGFDAVEFLDEADADAVADAVAVGVEEALRVEFVKDGGEEPGGAGGGGRIFDSRCSIYE